MRSNGSALGRAVEAVAAIKWSAAILWGDRFEEGSIPSLPNVFVILKKEFFMKTILNSLKQFFNSLDHPVYLVGGAVRDLVLGLDPKDLDLEVFGIMPKDFGTWLALQGVKFEIEPNAKFPVVRFKVAGEEVEVGFPRRDNKVSEGHMGFEIKIDPDMTVKEAARRRDFTINAMYLDIANDEVLDPFSGVQDLQERILRPVDPETFREDPLRIFRAMQFIARFRFAVWDDVLNAITPQMAAELDSIAPTSIWKEFEKMISKVGSIKGAELAMIYLGQLSAKFGIFPIFAAMAGTPQNPEWHMEGNVFEHTKEVLRAHVCQRLNGDDLDKTTALYLSCLVHDMGKVMATAMKNGKITAYGHEKKTEAAINFLEAIGCPKKIKKQVLTLTELHMLGPDMKAKTCLRTAEMLAKAGLTFHDWGLLKQADTLGSKYKDAAKDKAKLAKVMEMQNRLEKLGILHGRLPELVGGKDVLSINPKTPGKKIGALLKEVRQLQFAGQLASPNEAKAFLRKRLD